MNYPDSARSYVSYSSAFGSPQESARSRGSWDTAHLVDSGSSGEMGNGNSTGSGGITYPSSVAYPYPLDSARSRGSWETPADQFFSPRATFRSNSGSDEWITPRADNKVGFWFIIRILLLAHVLILYSVHIDHERISELVREREKCLSFSNNLIITTLRILCISPS